MDPFVMGVSITRIPTCSHFFHPPCLKKWFNSPNQSQDTKCPLCNKKITVKDLKEFKEMNKVNDTELDKIE